MSGHREGLGGGGAPQYGRTSQSSKKGPPPNRGADKPQERTREELQEGPSREDRRDKEAQATKALGSLGRTKGRPQRDRWAAGKGLKTEEKKEYKGSKGQAVVRASGRIDRGTRGPVQATGRSSIGQDTDQPGKEPSKESQEGSSSGSKDTSRDPEDERCSIDRKE